MIIHVPPKARKYHSQLVSGYYEARKRIFKDRMQWDVHADNNIETDSFDHDHAHYLISCFDNEVIGGVRLTPSLHPNLTFECFEKYFGNIDVKRTDILLESSRFGIENRPGMQSSILRNATLDLFCSILQIALSYGFKEIITVVDVRMERIIGLSGWEFNRVCDVVQIGKTPTVVGILPVDRKYIEIISKKLVRE